MPAIAVVVGILLIVIGLGGYLGTGRASVTALIPAFLGAAILLAGLVAHRPSARKHAMHAAAAVALLGFLGGAGRALPKLLAGETSTAVTLSLVMALVCLAFVILCVRSFINARRTPAAT
jgi:hypothetical protein